MTAQILDGKVASAAIKDELRERVAKLADQGIVPGLATVIVGDDPASHAYVRMKHKACAAIGLASFNHELPGDASRETVLERIAELNADPAVDGYLIQLPVPNHLDSFELLMAVDPDKDADGLHPVNLGRLALGAPGPRPCTPVGIQELLSRNGIEIPGTHVVCVGRGTTIGRPLSMLLTLKEPRANATLTQCHTGTPDLGRFTRQADILVAAAGVPGLITADMVRPGAVVVDVGSTRTEAGPVGDVAADVAEVAGWLAPIPGGVGPMTIALLLSNAVEAAERRSR